MRFEYFDPIFATTLRCTEERKIGALLEEWLDATTGLSPRFQAVGDGGELLVPDAYYLVDALLHYFELWDENSLRGLTGGLGVVAFMGSDQVCDICKDERARYDAAMHPSSTWAFMCGACYRLNSRRFLGMGVGQFLAYPNLDTGGCVDLYKHLHAVKFGSYP